MLSPFGSGRSMESSKRPSSDPSWGDVVGHQEVKDDTDAEAIRKMDEYLRAKKQGMPVDEPFRTTAVAAEALEKAAEAEITAGMRKVLLKPDVPDAPSSEAKATNSDTYH